MEFRQLQYVVQLAEDQNFSRAAEKLHIAQPSLSQQLSKLEKEIGVQLFQRDTSSVNLTHAGHIFVDRAQKIIDMIEQLRIEMDDLSQMRSGKLVIGSLPITGSHILPLVLPMFRAKYPDIEIVLLEETSAQLEMLTSKGQADVSLLSLPIADRTLAHVPVIEERIRLAVSPQHPLAQVEISGGSHRSGGADHLDGLSEADHLDGSDVTGAVGVHRSNEGTGEPNPVSLHDLKDEPFIILKRGQGFRQITLDLCEQAGFTPRIVFESSNIETVQSLVATGMGIAFVPDMVTRTKWSHFTPIYLDLAEKPSRTLVIAYREGRYISKATEAFIDIMLEVVKA